MILRDAVTRADRQVGRSDPRYQATLINAIYDRRIEYVAGLRDQARAQGRLGEARNFSTIISKRYPAERREALDLLRMR